MQDTTIDADANESLRAQVLDHDVVCDLTREAERKRHGEPRSGGQGEHRVYDRLHRVRFELAAADRTERATDARPQQAQVVVDLGGGTNGGARGLRRILLLDRDGGREAVDGIDVGLLHPLQKLARVGRERLDVSSLTFGVDGVERQR